MNEKKKRRFPAERLKLHALLQKREQDLLDLTEEVKELRRAARAADHAAINDVADEYNITPEEFMAFINARKSGVAFPAIVQHTPQREENINENA